MPTTTLGPFLVFNKSLTRAQGISLALHGSLIAILVIPALAPPPGKIRFKDNWLVFSGVGDPPPWKSREGKNKRNAGGGSGGARENQPATKGSLPPFARLQFTPPGRHYPEAEIQMPPTLLGPNFTPPAPYPVLGIPAAKEFNDSQGPGGGNGHGDNCCGGNGPGKDRGHGPGENEWLGGPGRGVAQAGRDGVSLPVCTYCPNPTFTEEAIRVRWQGEVVLRLIVTAEGLPTNVSVVRGAGYGLDERALAAVRNWRFAPSRDAVGRPVAASLLIEVRFHQF